MFLLCKANRIPPETPNKEVSTFHNVEMKEEPENMKRDRK